MKRWFRARIESEAVAADPVSAVAGAALDGAIHVRQQTALGVLSTPERASDRTSELSGMRC